MLLKEAIKKGAEAGIEISKKIKEHMATHKKITFLINNGANPEILTQLVNAKHLSGEIKPAKDEPKTTYP